MTTADKAREQSAESYVADFVAHGEINTLKLEPWEQAYQDVGLIAEAARKGYLCIDNDVRCSVTLTDAGRTVADLYSRLAALTASPAQPKCATCNDQGLIETGRLPDDSDPQPCPDCSAPAQGELISVPREKIARIMEPGAWASFDNTLRPFEEQRGAMQSLGEGHWYERAFRCGCRSIEDARRWWFETADAQTEAVNVQLFRDSLAKADAILALAASPVAPSSGEWIKREAAASAAWRTFKTCFLQKYGAWPKEGIEAMQTLNKLLPGSCGPVQPARALELPSTPKPENGDG